MGYFSALEEDAASVITLLKKTVTGFGYNALNCSQTWRATSGRSGSCVILAMSKFRAWCFGVCGVSKAFVQSLFTTGMPVNGAMLQYVKEIDQIGPQVILKLPCHGSPIQMESSVAVF